MQSCNPRNGDENVSLRTGVQISYVMDILSFVINFSDVSNDFNFKLLVGRYSFFMHVLHLKDC